MAEDKPSSSKGENTGMAVVAYIIFFLPLLTDAKDDPFVKYHVKQGLVLLLFWLAVSILGSIIPFLGWFLIMPIGGVVAFVLLVIGIMNAINGQQKPLPLIGQFAENFKF